jgi:hypothetical protein
MCRPPFPPASDVVCSQTELACIFLEDLFGLFERMLAVPMLQLDMCPFFYFQLFEWKAIR